MTEHAFLADLPLYALGALSGEEKERLQAHLAAGCPICEAELFELRHAVSLLPHSLPEQPLPPGLKVDVMRRIEQERTGEKRDTSFGWGLAVAAAVVLAAGLGALWWMTRQELASGQQEAARLQSALEDQKAELAWIHDPRVQMALLKGLEGAPNASARLLWNPESKHGILLVRGLPPLPLEKSYELWAFVADRPVPAGVFDSRPDGTTVFTLNRQESLGQKPTKFAVSIEPRGGMPQPTGSVVLLGESF
jgi:anti-sigma-K factor RskA